MNGGGFLLCGLGAIVSASWLVDRITFLGKLRWALGAPILVTISIAFALAASLNDRGEANVAMSWLFLALLGGVSIVFIFLGARSAGLGVARSDLFSQGKSVASVALITFASGVVLITAEPSETSRWWLTAIGLTVAVVELSALVSFVSPSPESARALVSATGIGLLVLSVVLYGSGASSAVVWSAAGASVGSVIWVEWAIWRRATEVDRSEKRVPS